MTCVLSGETRTDPHQSVMSKRTEIPLGFEVGTGNPVSIPLRHTVITGQSQEAGKTTTLEALIHRANLPAAAFVTKRGEGSFANGRRIQPYLKERADWQFVASVLEATMRERLKFERAWIMRASKGARTLADVQTNVRRLMQTAKGMSADVYLTLDAYLDIVVPRVQSIRWADTLDLSPGLNVIDVSDRDQFPPELQSLVMRSVLEWVYENANGVITIIPEAWEHIPQARGSPVKLGAIELIRKGAALRNYVWLDSQDIGGVDKELLRSCPVWVLGVQREANEVKRTLSNIPASLKRPKPEQISTLGKGQFYACFGHEVHKVYVQPAWMSEEEAQAIARGTRNILDASAPTVVHRPAPVLEMKPVRQPEPEIEEDDDMAKDNEIRALQGQLGEITQLLKQKFAGDGSGLPKAFGERPAVPSMNGDEEAQYQRFRSRLLSDPAVIRVLVERPLIDVLVDVPTIDMDGKSLKGRLALMMHNGFFKTSKLHKDALAELRRTGPDVNGGNLSKALADFVKMGFLTDESDGFREVASMRANIKRASA